MEEEKPVEQGEKSGVDNNTEKDIAEKDDAKEESAEKADDERESEEIDIYLFSNGQMYSPPRKYHLRADELQQWKATLGYLARKQYGSLHSSVELYELDGRKVEDPKSIRDCAVYVAVVPPDPFIYAGYDKYLVKASKSFEKRLSKRANGLALGETSSPDDIQNDGTNVSKLSQDFTPAPAPVKDNDLRPTYPSSRKNTEGRKSSVKNLNQKLDDKTKPISNQSVEEDAPHLCCRKDRVVVYQCACCTQTGGENTNYKLTANPTFTGQGIYVLLPVAMPVQNSIEAPCQKCDQQVQHAESFIKANFNISNKETLTSVPGDGDKPTIIKSSNMSQNIKVNDKFIYDNPMKQQVAIQGQDVEQSRLIMMRTDPSQTSARYNMESKQQQTTTFSQDQFTQTDWCDVLLEARAEADGRYTFYLPPLHLLQQYTLR